MYPWGMIFRFDELIKSKQVGSTLVRHMQTPATAEIRHFPTYEMREIAFSRSVFNLIPCRHNGPKRFWKDFKRIAGSGLQDIDSENVAYVSADPRDCLAFGTPAQVLSAACMGAASGRDFDLSPHRIAVEMGIETLLNQPIRTLSGGESVKLALAKVLASSAASSKLVVSSPFSWLSQANRTLFNRVLDRYHRQQVPTEILALEGEDDLAPLRPAELGAGIHAKAAFSLEFSGAWMNIGALVNSVADEQPRARVADFSGAFSSPCLLVGGNGQGKSLLAKSLSGAIATRGKAVVESGRTAGRARLLFQDVISQTLLRSFDGILGSAKKNRRGQALMVYQHLRQGCEGRPGEAGRRFASPDPESPAVKRTLLEIKMILIAVRLAERPPALILDEPDWGLSRRDAVALVAATIGMAHSLDVPVLLISHKPWWQPLAGSVLQVEKAVLNEADCRFEIRLQQL